MNGEQTDIDLATTVVTQVVIRVYTRNQDETYVLKQNFTGRVTIDFNQGGIAGVERLEKIK